MMKQNRLVADIQNATVCNFKEEVQFWGGKKEEKKVFGSRPQFFFFLSSAWCLVFVRAIRFSHTEADKCHNMFSLLCLISIHLQVPSKTVAWNLPHSFLHVFPSAWSCRKGREQLSTFATTLSADNAHANPALTTCCPPPNLPPHPLLKHSDATEISDYLWAPHESWICLDLCCVI